MSRPRGNAGLSGVPVGRRRSSLSFLLVLAIGLLMPLVSLHAQTVYEGDAKGNAIEGAAVKVACAKCLDGEEIGYIGNGNANYLRIKNISVATTGTYTVTLYYLLSGSRSFTIQVNGGSGPTLNLTGTSWTTPASTTFSASFTAGSTNSVGFFNASAYAPNVDHITVSSGGGGGGGGGGTTLSNVYITLYGWYDNSPAGNAIAYPANAGYPTLHNVATAGQTYSSPGTFATDALSGGEMKVGTKIYVPHFQKYFILEDECSGSGPDPGNCEYDWQHSGIYHVDLWLGGNPPANANDVNNCEYSLTIGSISGGKLSGGGQVIENPPSNETVNTTPLYNSSTNTCW
jgi:hypothetical protein